MHESIIGRCGSVGIVVAASVISRGKTNCANSFGGTEIGTSSLHGVLQL